MSAYMIMLPDEAIVQKIELAIATLDGFHVRDTATIIQLGTLCKAWSDSDSNSIINTLTFGSLYHASTKAPGYEEELPSLFLLLVVLSSG